MKSETNSNFQNPNDQNLIGDIDEESFEHLEIRIWDLFGIPIFEIRI